MAFWSKNRPEAKMDLTGAQWKIIKNLLPPTETGGRGRPPVPCRRILNGIFWKLRTRSNWREIPPRYPSRQTCVRYYSAWRKSGLLLQILQSLHEDLVFRGRLTPHRAILERRIVLVQHLNTLTFLLDPLYADDWRTNTALLLLQYEFRAASKRLIQAHEEGRLVYKNDFGVSFRFDEWPNFAPLTWGQNPADLLGPEQITLVYPSPRKRDYVLILQTSP